MPEQLRSALRSVIRTPHLSAAIILSLGLGIGLNTAVFSVVNTVLLRPLPYPDPGELVVVRAGLKSDGIDDALLPGGVFAEVRREVSQLQDVAALAAVRQNFTGVGLPAQVQIGWISTNLFRMIGVSPALGRDFAIDEPPGRIILGHDFWVRQFASDPAVVGRRVFLDGFAYEVVGVMPSGFRLELPRVPKDIDAWKAPDDWWQNGDIWAASDLASGVLRLVGRLRSEKGLDAARSELSGLGARLRDQSADLKRAEFFLTADPLHSVLVSRVRAGLWLLLGAAGAVLLIACANVMNVQLVRGQRRRRELATRLAIGAPRSRVIRELSLEALMLAILGCGLGLVFGQVALGIFDAVRPTDLPRWGDVALDFRVMGFAAALGMFATLLFGLLPAVAVTGIDPARELHGGHPSPGAGRQWASASLVSTQVALSLVLMLGVGLLGQSLRQMYAEPLGFAGERLLTFTVSLPGARYERPGGPDLFLRRLAETIEGLPGARAAGAIWPLPFSDRRWSDVYEGGTVDVNRRANADYRLVSPPLFDAIGSPILDGRAFMPSDSRNTVVVSRSLADRAFPDGPAVGATIRANPWGGNPETFQIVGVVEDQRHRSRHQPPTDAIYFDSKGWSWTDWEIGVVVRTDGDPMRLVDPIRAELARLDPEVPMADVRTMEARLADDVAPQRFALSLVGVFALIALVLAVLGIHSVISWNVAQRRREIGIRIAIGASRAAVVRAVAGRGVLAACLGVMVGLLAAVIGSRFLADLLYGVDDGRSRLFLSGSIALLSMTMVAAYVPARKAADVDPASTLRAE